MLYWMRALWLAAWVSSANHSTLYQHSIKLHLLWDRSIWKFASSRAPNFFMCHKLRRIFGCNFGWLITFPWTRRRPWGRRPWWRCCPSARGRSRRGKGTTAARERTPSCRPTSPWRRWSGQVEKRGKNSKQFSLFLLLLILFSWLSMYFLRGYVIGR